MKKKSIRTLADLKKNKLLDHKQLPDLEKVVEEFSVAITPQMQKLIDPTNEADPIAKQFVPATEELTITSNETRDPIGDNVFTQVKGIIHRYVDRCLFTPVHICPVYCRFCFRREKVGKNSQSLSKEELNNALKYIQQHTEIWEVILTGGDPLILKPASLKKIMQWLASIEHVDIIRLHTRVPIVASHTITADMIAALKNNKTVYVLLHANHPKEFTPEAIKACAAIIDAGIPMLSQTVLLKNINDNIEVLSQLMRCFVKNRIKPYYLHHCDLARGTSHFRTSIKEGQALIKQLHGRFSGLCQPTYVLDIPGGYGKAPVGPNYLHDNKVEDYQGELHEYQSLQN